MLIPFVKRLVRAPMSESDLLKIVGALIANPPIPDDIRTVLTARKYTDGQTLLEGWRSEIKLLIKHIAAEKTWALQRQRLIHFRVAAASWIALYRAVGDEPRISLWRDYVEGIGEFATNPVSAWENLLPKVFYFATLQNAVLSSLGMACYATDDMLDHYLQLFTHLRQHVIEKGLVLDRGLQDLNNVNPDLAESLMTARNQIIFPHYQTLFRFLRELGDRIETGSVQESMTVNRWAEMCGDVNEHIRALGVHEHLGEVTTL